MNITLKHGPGIPKKAGSTILAPGEPGWSTDLEKLYVGTADPQVPAMVGRPDNFVNVKDHGAKGDGTTDDTAAIMAAQTEASKRNIAVFFPKGTYKSANLGDYSSATVGMHVKWFGEDPSTTEITAVSSGAVPYVFNTEFKVELHDLTLSRRIVSRSWKRTAGMSPTIYQNCVFKGDGTTVYGNGVVATLICCAGTIPSGGVDTQTHIGCNYNKVGFFGGARETFFGCNISDEFTPAGTTSAPSHVMVISDGYKQFNGCTFTVNKNTTENLFEWNGGSLSAIQSVLKLNSTSHSPTFTIFHFGDLLASLVKDSTIDLDINCPSNTPRCVHMPKITNAIPNGINIRSHLPKAKTTIKKVAGTPTYEHHTDGIWWNGAKITP